MSFTVNEMGGTFQETLTVDQIPSHRHMGAVQHSDGETCGEYANTNYVAGTGRLRQIMSYVGGNQAHNNISPFYSANYWRRIS